MPYTLNNPMAYNSRGLAVYSSTAVDPTIVSVLTAEGGTSAVAGTRVYLTVTSAGAAQGNGVVGLGNLLLSEVSWSATLISGVIPFNLTPGEYNAFIITDGAKGALKEAAFTVSESGLDPVSQFFTSLRSKLIGSSYIASESEVLIGLESLDPNSPTLVYPRYEVLIDKDKMDGYASQRMADYALRFNIAGYLQRDSKSVAFDDTLDLIKFGMETRRLVYSMNDDKQAGNPPCDGFLYIGQFTETFYEFELFGKISTFLMACEASIQISDTEVG